VFKPRAENTRGFFACQSREGKKHFVKKHPPVLVKPGFLDPPKGGSEKRKKRCGAPKWAIRVNVQKGLSPVAVIQILGPITS